MGGFPKRGKGPDRRVSEGKNTEAGKSEDGGNGMSRLSKVIRETPFYRRRGERESVVVKAKEGTVPGKRLEEGLS